MKFHVRQTSIGFSVEVLEEIVHLCELHLTNSDKCSSHEYIDIPPLINPDMHGPARQHHLA